MYQIFDIKNVNLIIIYFVALVRFQYNAKNKKKLIIKSQEFLVAFLHVTLELLRIKQFSLH